jgi:hypothetical protein
LISSTPRASWQPKSLQVGSPTDPGGASRSSSSPGCDGAGGGHVDRFADVAGRDGGRGRPRQRLRSTSRWTPH